MVFLMILLIISALILFLLLLPLRLSIVYDADARVTLSVLFLHFSLYPQKEKKIRYRDYSKKKIRKRRRKERIKAVSEQHKTKKEESLKEKLRTIRLLFYILKRSYRKLLHAFRIRVCRLHATIATGDAAKTAILYGAATQTFSYALVILEETTKTKFQSDDIGVYADFCGERSQIDMKIVLTTNLFRVLAVALRAGRSFLEFNKSEKEKNNSNGGTKNERKQSE